MIVCWFHQHRNKCGGIRLSTAHFEVKLDLRRNAYLFMGFQGSKTSHLNAGSRSRGGRLC